MLLRRKLSFALFIAAILFLMLASQSINKRHFLPVSLTLPTIWATGASRDSVVGLTEAPADLTNDDAEATPPPSMNQPKTKEEPKITSKQRSCGCSKTCISDLGTSSWFTQRYNPKMQPIIRKNGNNFDPNSLKWWLGLQHSGNGQNLEDVLSKLFQVISPPTMDFSPLPTVCRKCAVVGNSGNLRLHEYGSQIDSHSYVMRMNKAVTRGFEKHVGNRTTHHLIYPESAVDIEPGVNLVLLPFKVRDLEWLTSAFSTGEIKMTYMRVKDRLVADTDKVMVLNPTFFKYVHDHWNENHGRYPSTGMLAIIFALHICDEVSVFGYGANEQGHWHHYWENNRDAGAFRKTGVHSGDFEAQVIQQLNKEGKITLYL
ncbi:ST3 beta-galactoside alpha-2,3-sialyltransferase 8 [Echeneis naucrates]|uniref:CMP-N-acetylneuraminate-beta-galactosamide-alpha-2,3-sialyltransferase 2 n=1 Tax=Echeneis naucrates TaxID=173247 RepID=A0A665XD68_ECHNA|nr:CMP-N-acetylneuraminate-beta-galactosamide-alpha-2,3-sialyltransferase 2-like [Echeneis naucrates]XP_029357927.1 CMP-N-acetylneuraminate-beta-galactosamide-alpha-2,3-sialyltransferase 2-like [Echeneis naucrates]XP_029357928.1 CMP-N-acetylneuraminate-beta-galactosamide-alpha-2,3-sialyltransferase 2-like [Echeneis naucrates]